MKNTLHKDSSPCRYYASTRGSALLISIVTVSLLILSTIGVTGLITNSLQTVKNIERSTAAHFAVEASVEDALFAISFHEPGFAISKDNEDNYGKFGFSAQEGVTQWWLENRAEINDEGYMVYPSTGLGDSEDGNWMTLQSSSAEEINLYVDNTSSNN